jgi:transcriptional regulator with XRE-family HTH domain
MILEILQQLELSPCDLAIRCNLEASLVNKIVKGGKRPTQAEADKIQFAIGELGKFLDVLEEWPHLNAGTNQGKDDVREERHGVFIGEDADEFHMDVAYEIDFADEIDTIEEVLAEMKPNEIAVWVKKQIEETEKRVSSSMLRRAVAFLVADKSPKNAKVCAVGLAFAGGLDLLGGNSMTKIAADMCLTRAAISKVANQAADALGIKRDVGYMRTQAARESYRKRAKEVHGRKK